MSLGLVRNVVFRYSRLMASGNGSKGTGKASHFSESDLTQEATIGLIQAAERFDPSRGLRFCTYAQWWVRKYVNESLQNQNRFIQIPVSFAHRVTRVSQGCSICVYITAVMMKPKLFFSFFFMRHVSSYFIGHWRA